MKSLSNLEGKRSQHEEPRAACGFRSQWQTYRMSKRLYELRPVTEEKGLKDGMISVGYGCVVSLQERNGRE